MRIYIQSVQTSSQLSDHTIMVMQAVCMLRAEGATCGQHSHQRRPLLEGQQVEAANWKGLHSPGQVFLLKDSATCSLRCRLREYPDDRKQKGNISASHIQLILSIW